MPSNAHEIDCIDCPVNPCDRESPECKIFGQGEKQTKLAERITRAVQAKIEPRPTPAPKGNRGRKLDFSRLDIAWFREHARSLKDGSVSVICADKAEFAAHGLPLKPSRMGKSWRCCTKNVYLRGLLSTEPPEAPRSRLIAQQVAKQREDSTPQPPAAQETPATRETERTGPSGSGARKSTRPAISAFEFDNAIELIGDCRDLCEFIARSSSALSYDIGDELANGLQLIAERASEGLELAMKKLLAGE